MVLVERFNCIVLHALWIDEHGRPYHAVRIQLWFSCTCESFQQLKWSASRPPPCCLTLARLLCTMQICCKGCAAPTLISGWPMRHPRDSRVAASALAGARAACRSASSCLCCCNAAASFASTSCANGSSKVRPGSCTLLPWACLPAPGAVVAIECNSSCSHADL
jgi:hypothetical protein